MIDVVGAGLVLVASVGAGTVAHELSHACALRAFGIPYEIEWFPAREDAGPLGSGVSGRLATVTPRAAPRDLSPWSLRTAAMMPLVLAAPLALAFAGTGPAPSPAGNAYLTAATIGWLACALPSPQDFSLFWYAERAIAEHARDGGST